MKIKQNKGVFHIDKGVIACQTQLMLQSVKQHDNLRKFPNAASITRGVELDKKKLAVPIITLVLSAERERKG